MKFYVLEHNVPKSIDALCEMTDINFAEGTETGDFPRCPHCGYPQAMREWLPPWRVEIETWGKYYDDVVPVTDELVVSSRFRTLFEANSLRGLSEFHELEVVKILNRRGRPKEPPPRYFKALIIRSSTTVDQAASGYEWVDKSAVCPVCLRGGRVKRYPRVVVDEKSWNGDDIFWPRGGPCVLVTERFKSVYETNGMRGVVFGLPEDESYDFFPWESEEMQKP
jgi:hypothetical protein